MEFDIPIDIHSNKLLDWLLSRRHCKREWQENAVAIREKINNALQDMPEHPDITKLLSGTYINYFHCQKIVEILKETELSSKNIFGRYTSQRMKDWQEILKMFEKDNVYLAEVAQILMRNVSYEVPSIKKQIAKCQQMQEECIKKTEDCVKNAKHMKDKYHAACAELGIQGKNIKAELVELVKELPVLFDGVIGRIAQLNDPVEYYKTFMAYSFSRTDVNTVNVLPTLVYLMSKGNTTVYEWRCGKKPLKVIEPVVQYNIEEVQVESSSTTDNIDLGDSGGIDFGDSGGIDFGDSGGIDFGDSQDTNAENIDFGDQIDFGTSSVNLDSGVNEDETAIGDDALTMLDCSLTRNAFLNDLYELEAFLKQRLCEMQMESDILSLNQFQSAPILLQLQTIEGISAMLSSIKEVFKTMHDVKLRHLILIKASARYVTRLADSLKQNLNLSDKAAKLQQTLIEKKNKAFEEQLSVEPKLDLIIQRTKELQKEVENDISKRYNNRTVNIIGGISQIG